MHASAGMCYTQCHISWPAEAMQRVVASPETEGQWAEVLDEGIPEHHRPTPGSAAVYQRFKFEKRWRKAAAAV